MNNINDDIDQLFDEIKESDLYKNYILSKNQLEANEEVMSIIKDIKRLQKIATNNNDMIVENNIKNLYKKLDDYPIYQTYKNLKDELTNELLIIKDTFSNYFKEILSLN